MGWLTYRWTIGLVGVFLSATTATWAISPAVTLVPAVLATFALLIMGTAIAHTTQAHLPALRADGRSEPDAVPPIDKPITGPAGDGAGQGSNR